jgi:hypothetical protein
MKLSNETKDRCRDLRKQGLGISEISSVVGYPYDKVRSCCERVKPDKESKAVTTTSL